ncbi:M14 family metallopeptidase [Sediminicola luteus]|uniref:Peptidase M14 domain-containing protein n=1 Tax=Sediminicola luteus TaxID=319238 RepID=A0A2A4G6W6_9FLAO|nr:M14 family metallopeptidase [Sediminicola luteus]PCE63482.1 hypothetical protein B7P33_14830 [Sediminicola luteus]
MKNLYFCGLFLALIGCETVTQNEEPEFTTVFETSKGSETATYQETLDFYMALAKEYPEINFQNIGETDSGLPLHLVTYNPEGEFDFNSIREEKAIILVNNGIHPGESDGIDATMMLFRDLASGKLKQPLNTVITAIPIYNVGGALNRNSYSRTNQNGPKSYGFRGNARNFDLNRDFIKSDTKNAQTFSQIFHLVKPHVFIDNHVSNGADYQYTLTHLFTQHNRLGGAAGNYLEKELRPQLENALEKDGWPITPYVNVFGRTPDAGFSQFMDYSRYSSGYTTLWNTLGMMVETHMLKPYDQRVKGTYTLMEKMLGIVDPESDNVKNVVAEAHRQMLEKKHYPLQWTLDSTQTRSLDFKGFEGEWTTSAATGLNRLRYDRSKPFEKPVTYYDHYKPVDSIAIPEGYLIPKQWREVIARLDQNQIEYIALEKDTVLEVESYRIADFGTAKSPFEGHYIHYNTQVKATTKNMAFKTGDLWVPTQQAGIRYLLETLEPQAPDSFFNWNYFDIILQQKEHFSPYVFEDTALNMLENDSLLKKEFDSIRTADPRLIDNPYSQLDWLHKRSKHYEKAHLQYPIYRVPKQ